MVQLGWTGGRQLECRRWRNLSGSFDSRCGFRVIYRQAHNLKVRSSNRGYAQRYITPEEEEVTLAYISNRGYAQPAALMLFVFWSLAYISSRG
jgi:hypothetical protein